MDEIGILTTRSHPLLPYLMEELAAQSDCRPVLIFDQKDFSEKDRLIFEERTRGAFPTFPADKLCRRHESVEVSNHNGSDSLDFVSRRGLRLLVNGGTPRRLSGALLEAVPQGVINVHPGILPKYRGATCCEWAIYYDEPVGVTAHFMDEGLDSGPILFTRQLRVLKGQDYTAVRVSLYHLALKCNAEAVNLVLTKKLAPSQLPSQPPGQPFKPIPDKLLAEAREKLATGAYQCAQ